MNKMLVRFSRGQIFAITFSLLAACLLIVHTPYAGAQAAAASPQKVTSVEGITEYRLPNGLKVLLFPDPSKPTAVVNITYLVGSRHENYGETGMAHLLEHLLFKGTPKNQAISAEHNKRGMRWNASTWLDRTNYWQLFQASDDNLEWALQMEADRMVNSFIAKKDLDSEMTVVRNEFESRENDPVDVFFKRSQSLAYDWHNYGNSTIGNRSDIENVKIENLQAFYRMYYQPDNAVLLVAGKFDEAKVLNWVSKYFAPIPKPTRTLPKLWTVEPTQDGERTFTVRRKQDIQIAGLAYKLPSGRHADAAALQYLVYALTDTPTGRLHKALVQSGKAQGIFYSSLLVSLTDGGLLVVGAVVKKGDPVESVQAEIVRIVEGLASEALTAEEMARAKRDFENGAERVLSNHESIGVQLSEAIALGDWRLFFYQRDRRQNVTAADVKAVAAKYFRRDNRVMGASLADESPQRAEIAAAPPAEEVLKDFKGKAAAAVAEAFDPGNENIDKRTKKTAIDGLNVSLLTKKNRGETVNVTMRLRFGDEKSLFGKEITSQMTAQMLVRGTTKFNRAQLSDEFDRLKMSNYVFGPETRFQTNRANLVEAIKLASHVLREPAFLEAEFEQLRKQSLTGVESQRREPQMAAVNTLNRQYNIFPRGDVRYTSTFDELEEDMKAVKLADVRAFHKNFYSAAKGDIAIAGDFDEAAVTATIRESFGNWKGGAPYTRLARPYKDVAPINQSLETPDKENAFFVARINLDLQDTENDFAAMAVANHIMGQAGFDSRLVARIRVKDGLSYGAGSQLGVLSTDRGAFWAGFAIAAPQNIAKVEAAFKDEVAKALKDGFTDAEVAAAKSGMVQQRLQQRAQDGNLANGLAENSYLGRTYAWSKALEEKITALKSDEVNAAFRKYIDVNKISIVKAGDFAKTAAGAKSTAAEPAKGGAK
jgi:zinc protease